MLRFIRDHFRPTLALKLGLLVLVSTGLIFAVGFRLTNRTARGLMLRSAEAHTRDLARGTVNRIEAGLRAVQALPELLARQAAGRRLGRDQLVELIQNELLASPRLYGSAVAYAPGETTGETKPVVLYLYRKEGRLQFVDLVEAGSDYASQDWYRRPRELGKAVWTEPYFDKGGGESLMCSYAVPFYRETNGLKTFTGVVTIDLELGQVVEAISSIKLYQSGYAFLLSQKGQIISHPNKDYVFKQSIFSLARETGDRQLGEIGRKMLRGGEGFERVRSPNTGLGSWLYYAPISNGWSVGMLFPEEEVLAEVGALNRVIYWVGILGFGVLLAATTMLSTNITRPVRILAQQTHEIARGNLDLPVPTVRSRDEVGDLSRSFENMRLALKEYLANLAATTAAKERIEGELKIAQGIQRSFLPKRFPPFPERTDFDVYAHLEPARTVGGDLYDFFLLDDQHLFFSIGDVSGKGVPAALFMAVTRTLVKSAAERRLSPSQVLAKVNHELLVDNDQMMFVTFYCGVLDLQTGELQYTNAGHLPPLRLRASGGVASLDLPKGLVLGIEEAPTFSTRVVKLEPMDTLLLYTDGVNEAMDAREELFGHDRLHALAAAFTERSPREMVEAIFAAVHQFARGAEQSDDIAVLALQYRGKAGPPGKTAATS